MATDTAPPARRPRTTDRRRSRPGSTPWRRTVERTATSPLAQRLRRPVLPPLVAVAAVLLVWQLVVPARAQAAVHAARPGRRVVARSGDLCARARSGRRLDQPSARRARLPSCRSSIGTPLGLLGGPGRSSCGPAIGPILSGLQSLPSVAWVPAGDHLVRADRRDDLRGRPARRGAVDRQRAGLRRRPGAAAVPAGRPGARRPRAGRGPAHRAARRAARLPRPG